MVFNPCPPRNPRIISERMNVMNPCCLIRSLRLPLLTIFVLFSLSFVARAHTPTATLGGPFLDPNGAVVPAANITVTEVSTGVQRTATTNDQGYFTIPLLKPSTYLLQVEHQGFMT